MSKNKIRIMGEEKKVEYVTISGGIRVRIDNPKPEDGNKVEQAQAKIDYYTEKRDKWIQIMRKLKYAEESRVNNENKAKGLR